MKLTVQNLAQKDIISYTLMKNLDQDTGKSIETNIVDLIKNVEILDRSPTILSK